MKKLLLSLILLLFCTGYLAAQNREIIRIKAGQDAASSFSTHGFYRFPVFSDGVVVFKNGSQTTGKFNYHLLNQEVQFISSSGDTLALADPLSINHITMDSNLFYYAEGYHEVLLNHESLKLTRKIRLDIKSEKIGAYGQASPSGSIRTPNKLILANTGKDLTINQDMIVQKEYTYFWLDKYSTVLKATKGNLLRMLSPDKKRDIEDYLKKNKIDFSKEGDLKKLLRYSLAIM